MVILKPQSFGRAVQLEWAIATQQWLLSQQLTKNELNFVKSPNLYSKTQLSKRSEKHDFLQGRPGGWNCPLYLRQICFLSCKLVHRRKALTGHTVGKQKQNTCHPKDGTKLTNAITWSPSKTERKRERERVLVNILMSRNLHLITCYKPKSTQKNCITV